MGSEKCDLCGGEMELKEKKIVAETEYNIFVCKKCHHEVARRPDTK